MVNESKDNYIYRTVFHFGDWLYSKVNGINPDFSSPGYKKIIIAPYVNDTLKYVNALYNSIYAYMVK
ncbi:MAG: hypothetical protein H0Z29_07000 [Candidatus Marinimicrobia bacterium]|nr:hypothetical protein [Candidatus Neomarinimicrobiota bacterium]